MNKKLLAFSLILLAAACSSSTKKKLGLHKTGPDESTVSAQERLIIPPIIADSPDKLPKPQPIKDEK